MHREPGKGGGSDKVVYLNAVRASNNLPALATRVVGRGEAIDLLAREVHASRLVSVVGAGGIGKTTVALAVAERAVGTFADGVWLVDFAPLRDASLVPHAISSATGLAVHSADVLSALCRFLRGRQLLLVLDNCEHMASSIAACLGQVFREAPGVHALATSRARLGIQDERVHTLPGLALPPPSARLDAQGVLAYPAVELFVDRAKDRMDTFVLRDEDAGAVADICRSLDGVALAIELAAMRVDAFGVQGLRQQLDDRFRLLGGRRGGLERHRALAATLDWSYSLLTPGEASLLQAVSIFPGAFQLHGASRVAGVSAATAAVILRELSSKSLLSIEGPQPDTSYRPLETTRAYCLDKLVRAGGDQPVRRRHAEHVCDVLERATGEWGQQRSRDWGATYGCYLDDMRAALAWAEAEPAGRSLHIRLTAAGTLLWNHFSLTDESRLHLTHAIARLRDGDDRGTALEMGLQIALAGAILYTRGVVPEARVAMRRALQLSEQLGEAESRLRCLRLIGTFELFYGEIDAALGTLETFSSIAAAQDPSSLAEGETHYSVGELFVGRLLGARNRMERLHARHAQDYDDTRFARFQYSNSVNVLVVLSHAQYLTGLPDTAARTAETILAYGRQATHELSLSIALAWNSLMYLWLGCDEDCSRQVLLLDELVEQHGIVTWRPIVTFCRGALAASRNPGCAEGIATLHQAVAEFRAIGHRARLPFYVAVYAQALAAASRFHEAASAIDEALELARVQNETWCRPEILRIQAFIAASQGQEGLAERLLQQSIACAREIGALAWQLRSSNDLAALWLGQSRNAEARPMLESVLGAFCEGAGTRDIESARSLLERMR